MKIPVHYTKNRVVYADNHLPPRWAFNGAPCWLGCGVYDKNGHEIFEGDILSIDFDKAQDIIGDGLLVSTLKVMCPAQNARLVVEFSAARFRLVWRTHNGGVDTGLDIATLSAILPAVEISSHITEVPFDD